MRCGAVRCVLCLLKGYIWGSKGPNAAVTSNVDARHLTDEVTVESSTITNDVFALD
jgi:hypothetical protein